MEELFLAKPSEQYKESFKKYTMSYKLRNDEEYYKKYKRALENFEDYIKDLDKAVTSIIPDYDVLTSTFWLIYKHNVVGVVRVRHEEVETAGHIGYDISPEYRGKGFGTSILRLALVEAKKIGLKEVIVTCSIDNDCSRKIIEKNEGELLGSLYDPEEDEKLYKYRIRVI